MEPLSLGVCCELNMLVNGINVLEEVMAVFCLLGDKGVIPKPKLGWIRGSADVLGFKLFHEEVGYKGTDRGTHGFTMDPLKILTLEEEVVILGKIPAM